MVDGEFDPRHEIRQDDLSPIVQVALEVPEQGVFVLDVMRDFEAERQIVALGELVLRAVAMEHAYAILQLKRGNLPVRDRCLLACDRVAIEMEVIEPLSQGNHVRPIAASEVQRSAAGREVHLPKQRLSHLFLRVQAHHGKFQMLAWVGEGPHPREPLHDLVQGAEGEEPLRHVFPDPGGKIGGRGGDGVVVFGHDGAFRLLTPAVLLHEDVEQSAQKVHFVGAVVARLEQQFGHRLAVGLFEQRSQVAPRGRAVGLPAVAGALHDIPLALERISGHLHPLASVIGIERRPRDRYAPHEQLAEAGQHPLPVVLSLTQARKPRAPGIVGKALASHGGQRRLRTHFQKHAAAGVVRGTNASGEVHGLTDMIDPVVGGRDVRGDRLAGKVRNHADLRRRVGDGASRAFKRGEHRLHQRRMKGVRDVQGFRLDTLGTAAS